MFIKRTRFNWSTVVKENCENNGNELAIVDFVRVFFHTIQHVVWCSCLYNQTTATRAFHNGTSYNVQMSIPSTYVLAKRRVEC